MSLLRPFDHQQKRRASLSIPADMLFALTAMIFGIVGLGFLSILATQSVSNPVPSPDPAIQPADAGFFPPSPAPSRSPIPRPGVHLRHLIPFKRLARLKIPPLTPGQIIPPARAGWYLGKTVTVEARVVEAKNIGSICFLDFSHHWHGQFAVILYRKTYPHWPGGPDRYFQGKRIRVTGKVVSYRGRPEIQVKNVRQIEVLAAPP